MNRIAEIKVKGSRQESLIEIHIDLYQIDSYETEHEVVKLFTDIAHVASKVYPGSRVFRNNIANRVAEAPRSINGIVLGSDLKPKPKRRWLSGKDFAKWFGGK